MERVIELLKRYDISANRVISLELLKYKSDQQITDMLDYLQETELLKSKFIIHSLASIINSTNVPNIKKVKKILDDHGYDSFTILYKANKVLTTSSFTKMEDVITE